MEFTPFDARHYPTLPVRQGYREWSATYEDVVLDELDLRLLTRPTTVAWDKIERAVDLACGTGHTGRWLRGQGVRHVDGVDLTPEMLTQAAAKRVYDQLIVADMRSCGLGSDRYGLAMEALADEHIDDLGPLYAEAARITRPGGHFVLVGYHPHFLMLGVPTHFDRADGESVAIQCHVHLFADHVAAAHRTGWSLAEMVEGCIDQAWLARRPRLARYRGHPVSFAMVWRH